MKQKVVNQVEFLGLVHVSATFHNILRRTRSKKVWILV